MLWENRDRYQIPTYSMAVDTVPSYASFIAGRCQLEKWESGTCPYFPTTESLLPFKAVHLEFQNPVTDKAPTRNGEDDVRLAHHGT